MTSRYPKNWPEIATKIKQKVHWRCQSCLRQCLKPGDNTSKLTKSERTAKTLVVHHCNYTPEDNREENLMALCTACHLSLHTGRRGNVCIGQLSLDFCHTKGDHTKFFLNSV
jgi:5-methylcytosine-specific restriction endonuclease McrA